MAKRMIMRSTSELSNSTNKKHFAKYVLRDMRIYLKNMSLFAGKRRVLRTMKSWRDHNESITQGLTLDARQTSSGAS